MNYLKGYEIMTSKWDMKQYIKKNPDKFPYLYKEDEDALYGKGDNKYICSLDTFLEVFRKKAGESFECIYNEHVSLFSVIRCTECGTVIFTHYDEDYEPRLRCPTCTDYKTSFTYWTKEDIESDEAKKAGVEIYESMGKAQDEAYERRKKRNGKYDWEIGSLKIKFKLLTIKFNLECGDITKSYLKGLRLNINIWKKEAVDELCSTLYKSFVIPLSWSQLKLRFRIWNERRKENNACK